MRLGSSEILALDLTADRIRLVHGAVTGRSLRVLQFASEELLTANPENVSQQLGTMVRRAAVRASAAAVVLSGPEVVHRVLEFPPMPVKELGPVVAREIRLLGETAGKEVAFDWEIIEESQGGNLEQVRVLVAIAPQSKVQATIGMLEACRLRPTLVTTTPLSLVRSLKFVRGGARGSLVVLYLGAEQGYLLGLRHGTWGFLREFSGHSKEGGGDGALEAAVREAGRAFLYFGQRHREEQKIAFLLGGEQRLEALRIRLQQESGAEAEVVRPGLNVDLTPLRERAAMFRESFPAFLGALGLVAASAEPGINLVPKARRRSLLAMPRLDFSLLPAPVWLFAVFFALIGVQWSLYRSEAEHRKQYEDRLALYARWLPAARMAEAGRELHDNERLLARVFGEQRSAEADWVSLFKWLSHVVPPDLVLQSVEVKSDQGQWYARLHGEVVAAELYSAQAAFNRFYQALKTSPRMEEIDLAPLRVSTLSELKPVAADVARTSEGGEAEAGEAPRREIKKTKVDFEMRALWSGS